MVSMTEVLYLLSSISGRVLLPTETPMSRQASCCIGLPLLREVAQFAFYMLWLCDIAETA